MTNDLAAQLSFAAPPRPAPRRVDTLPASGHGEIRSGIGLARKLIAKGDLGNAWDIAQRMAAIEPGNGELHMLQATILEANRSLGQAVEAYDKVLALVPGYMPAHVNRAACLFELERYPDALAACLEALRIDPEEEALHRNIAQVYGELRRDGDAVPHLVRVAARSRDVADHVALAQALDRAGRLDEAAAAYRTALPLSPAKAPIHVLLSTLYRIRGQTEAADRHLADALAADPADGHAVLAQAKRDASRLEPAAVEAHLAATAGRPAEIAEGPLRFTLARLHEARDDAAAAFAQFTAANAVLEPGLANDDELRRSRAWAQAKALTRANLEAARAWGNDSALPLFVTGMPRSGTTLVEQIVASHPQAAAAGELELIPNLVPSLSPPSAAKVARCAAAYLAADGMRQLGAARIVDKSLSSWLHVGVISLMFPNARIVAVRRHPMDVCWSAFTEQFGANAVPYTYNLDRLAAMYQLYEALLEHWRSEWRGRVHELRYERLVADPEAEARALVAHAGLDWDERCLAFHAGERTVRTASMSQVRQPLYASSVGRWRRYQRELEPLAHRLAAEIAAYEG